MKPSTYRRFRRHSASHEMANAKKENRQEQPFFGSAVHETFFQPSPVINRKCDKCEEEDKKAPQQPGKKEESKKMMPIPGKKEEEEIQKKEDKKEEEKLMKKEEEKEKDKDKLQKKATGPASVSSAGVTNYVSNLSGKGNPLPVHANHFFSSRMGFDFSNVKIHTGKEASDAASQVNAKAFTIGNHIVFNEGQFNTASGEGKKLMAHELVHVMQQNKNDAHRAIQRKTNEGVDQEQQIWLPPIRLEVEGSQIENTTHNADCNGVSVSGSTSANYSSSGSLNGRPSRATDCSGCTGNDCITINSTVVSVFRTAPVVSLPPVPGGLNPCERRAVRNFINTTLNQHEQQHVAAFNTYRGTVRTPISFTGCSGDLQAEVQSIHDNIEVPRRAASDAASAALDANGANIFNITCECPDPAP